VRRGLSYYSGSRRTLALLSPADFGAERLGHFALFHSRHREDFWPATLRWLQHGAVPWPTADCWPGPSKEALPGARH
jgi:hypothetical protein